MIYCGLVFFFLHCKNLAFQQGCVYFLYPLHVKCHDVQVHAFKGIDKYSKTNYYI